MLLVFNPAQTEARPLRAPARPAHGSRGPGHVAFAAAADELDGWRERLDGGVAIEADFRWPSGARSIYVRDPAGNSVEFAEPRTSGLRNRAGRGCAD